MNTHQAQGGLGRGHGDDGLRRHQKHLEHRNRGARARRPRHGAAPCLQLKGPQRARARSRHARTAPGQHASHRKRRCTSAAAAATAATGQQHAHARRTAHRTHCARPPRAAASSSAANARNHARPAMHDDEKMLRAHTGTKPETPIDGVQKHWAFAPATGRPPCSSHTSVAHTATRPSSSQGPASALALKGSECDLPQTDRDRKELRPTAKKSRALRHHRPQDHPHPHPLPPPEPPP